MESCPLCNRPIIHAASHHLVPACRGGKATLCICKDCHRVIHSIFTNKELEKEYHTVESLLSHEKFKKMVDFISKQDPGGRVKVLGKKHSGRNG